ncbi:hypothetical protein I4U23_022306 [Adineta vaga]|nr:hypothetical protein I4U23_022306 [Adineta vaga]
MPPMELTSASVRQLDVRGYTSQNTWCCFNEEQCYELTRSPLGIQCVTLLIRVQTRQNILDLLNNMPNLQALAVECEDDYWTKKDDSVEDDFIDDIDNELLEWLRQQLPSVCVTRQTLNSILIRIWIR